jgi:hypothetical protein
MTLIPSNPEVHFANVVYYHDDFDRLCGCCGLVLWMSVMEKLDFDFCTPSFVSFFACSLVYVAWCSVGIVNT